jgi:ubiquinone/menaquinone biosynthesis C-methylase UbiE
LFYRFGGDHKVKKYDAREICALFDRGENIIEWINFREGAERNSATAILYSYDAQAGSYTRQLDDPRHRELRDKLGQHLASILDELAPDSLLEAGTGEATSLVSILRHLKRKPAHVLGFDLSLSRLLFARKNLVENSSDEIVLFTGSLDRIPLASASIDVALTIHALEPNHGYEEEILAELLRVVRRQLILVEPSYENASAEARARMDRLGYARGIPETLKRLGYAPRVERFPYYANPLNESALVIVDKPEPASRADAPLFVSPISGRKLLTRQDCLYCPDDGHAFPVIAGIPCLVVENGVLVSKLDELVRFDTKV